MNKYADLLLNAGALTLRDIDAGEPPFLYSSGMKGPGYVMVKGLVSQRHILEKLTEALAAKIELAWTGVDFVAANATGGMVPGWELAARLEDRCDRRIPYVYIRGSRKKGGHKELITGLESNPEIKIGANALVVEELVNFAETTCNSVTVLREAGYVVTSAACILFYDHAAARQALKDANVELIHLVTLSDMLDAASAGKLFPQRAINDYRSFLADPQAWMDRRGLKREASGTL